MLSGEGKENYENTIGLIGKKATLHVQHTFCTFLCLCFARLQRETSRNFRLLVLCRKCHSLCRSFSPWWPLAFLIFPPPLQNLCCSSNEKMSPLSFISPSSCLSLFFSLSFAGLSPTFSFSLLLPFCAFQICGHDNKSKLNTLDNADTETISAFRFRLYRLFSLPHNTRVAM